MPLRVRLGAGAVAPRPLGMAQPVWPRLAAFLRSLPDRALIDRLVRGRAWIPVLGVMLVGIVAMQVEVLKLGAGIGRAVERTSELSAQNESLRASVAALGDDQRIESAAAKMGMVMPAPGAVGFLRPFGAGSRRAAANVHAPNAAQFLAASSSNGAVATPAALGATAAGGASTTPAAPASGLSGAAPASATPTNATAANTTGAAPAARTPAATPTGASTGATAGASGSGGTAGASGTSASGRTAGPAPGADTAAASPRSGGAARSGSPNGG